MLRRLKRGVQSHEPSNGCGWSTKEFVRETPFSTSRTVPERLRWWDQRLHKRPLGIGQITRVAMVIAYIDDVNPRRRRAHRQLRRPRYHLRSARCHPMQETGQKKAVAIAIRNVSGR